MEVQRDSAETTPIHVNTTAAAATLMFLGLGIAVSGVVWAFAWHSWWSIWLWMPAAFGVVLGIVHTRRMAATELRTVAVDGEQISGETFSGDSVVMGWGAVSRVAFRNMRRRGPYSHIAVESADDYIRIGAHFGKFEEIAGRVRGICLDRGIACEEPE